QIWDAVAAFKTRQQEILHELIRLTPRGVRDAVIAFFLNKAGTAQIGEHLLRCDTDFIPPLSGRVEIHDCAHKIGSKATLVEAWSGDTLVGLVAAYCYELEKHIAFITNVSVLKEWSGKGIAGDLLKWCVEHVKAMGMRQVNLKVAIGNTVAIRLYEQNGFVARKRDAPFTTMNLCLKSEDEDGQQAGSNPESGRCLSEFRELYRYTNRLLHHAILQNAGSSSSSKSLKSAIPIRWTSSSTMFSRSAKAIASLAIKKLSRFVSLISRGAIIRAIAGTQSVLLLRSVENHVALVWL